MILPYLSGAFLGWSLGANDSANTFGPAVSSRMVPYRMATILIAVFVIAGAYVQGSRGIETLSSLTVQTRQTAWICSLSAALAVTMMTILKLPVSASQAAVGAIMGIGIIQRQIEWSSFIKVVVCWLSNPVVSVLICVVVYHSLRILVRIWKPTLFEYDPVMRSALVLCGCYSAYTLGANSAANVGAVFVGKDMLTMQQAVLFGGVSIALGALTYSRRVMMTVGKGIVKLDVFSSLCTVLSLAITVHVFALIGVPVSTSQAIVGAVLGISVVKGLQIINFRRLVAVFSGWVSTPIVACLIALALCAAFKV